MGLHRSYVRQSPMENHIEEVIPLKYSALRPVVIDDINKQSIIGL